MDNKYLLSYLKSYYNDPRMDRVLDYFKVDFDYYLYAYGCQFGSNDNLEKNIQFLYDNDFGKVKSSTPKKFSLKILLKNKLISIMSKAQNYSIEKQAKLDENFKKVLFYNKLPRKAKSIFAKHQIRVVCLDDYLNDNYPQILEIFKWYDSLSMLSFAERLQLGRYDCLDVFIRSIQETFNDFDGFFVGNDEYFLSKLFIDAFKGMGIPTYNWSHGIDAEVGIPMRTDYLLVWGPALKENLIKDGKSAESIIVSGNIHYFEIPAITHFRTSLNDVLVLTSVTVANIRHNWDYNTFAKWDRSLLITYIYSVEKVLKSIGVKHARLRPHPINNKLWVEKFIDTDFFTIDYLPLNQSLEKATLAIGPTSSTFVESLQKGLTYLIYEPGKNERNLVGLPLIPPYDGSDNNVKVAFDEDQLKELIETKYTYNPNILDKYMVPFDVGSFRNTLDKKYQQK